MVHCYRDSTIIALYVNSDSVADMVSDDYGYL